MASRIAIGSLVLVTALSSRCASATAQLHSCGVASVVDLAYLLGSPIDTAQRRQLQERYGTADASMLDIEQAAAALGIPLLGVKAPLQELTTALRGPKIIHLQNPRHFVVIARASREWLQLLSGGGVLVVPAQDIEKRYSGHALILQQEHESGGPRVQLEEFHDTFGIAGVGQQVEHTFTLTNVGDGELVVRPQGRRCCGAPDVSIGTETLAPAESTTVSVSFTVTHSGNVMKSVKLLTTDPMQPVVFLTVHGTVPHNVRVRPDRLSVRGAKGDVPAPVVTVSGPEGMKLTEVTYEQGLFYIHVSEPSVDQAGKKTWQLQITFKRDNFVGEIEDQLAIHTTHEERPLITVPISGEIRGDLQVHPPSVFFGFVEPGEQVADHVTIESRARNEFTIGAATTDTAKVHVGDPNQQDGAWRIPVSVDTSEPGVVDAELTVTTDVPGENTLEIPVYAHVLEYR